MFLTQLTILQDLEAKGFVITSIKCPDISSSYLQGEGYAVIESTTNELIATDSDNEDHIYKLSEGDMIASSPPADWEGLATAILIGTGYSLVVAWYNGLGANQRDPLQTAIAQHEADRIGNLVGLLSPDTATIVEINQLLSDFNISLVV